MHKTTSVTEEHPASSAYPPLTLVAFITFVLCSLISSSAQAELIAFDFEAIVYNVELPSNHPLEGMIATGQTISGRFRYNTSLVDQASAVTNFGSYQSFPAGQNSFRAQGGNGFVFDSQFSSNPFFVASVDDGTTVDTLLLNLSGDTTPSTLALPNTQFVEVGLLLETSDVSTFSDDGLPEELSLASFPIAGIDFFGSGFPFPTFLVQSSITSLTTVPLALGDFDSDNDVDSNDLQLWRAGFGIAAGASPFHGDADADGDVDGTDFLLWQEYFGNQSGVSVLSLVPEPSTLAILLIGTVFAYFARPTLALLR